MARFRLAKGVLFSALVVCSLVPVAEAQSQPQSQLESRVKSQPEAKDSQESLTFFESKIRPVLVEQCYSCHSQEAATKGKLKGGLYLDSRDGMLRGGDTGPAISSEHSEESLILKALRYEEYEMPPSGKLSANIIEDIERWVAQADIDPRRAAEPIKQKAMDLEAGRKFWSRQP
ncbi:MAG: c-type cytochrome domain-containing protein, partial [Planctomycetota bacterium]